MQLSGVEADGRGAKETSNIAENRIIQKGSERCLECVNGKVAALEHSGGLCVHNYNPCPGCGNQL